jgi:hypothetical protein
MENINEKLFYWGKVFNSEEDQLKGNEQFIILRSSLLEVEERVKKILSSKANRYKKDNIIEIWSSTKDLKNYKLISTHKR